MNPNTIETPELLTTAGLAQLMKVSLRTVQRLAKEADFPRPLRIRGCVRWDKAEVTAYLESLKTKASKPSSTID